MTADQERWTIYHFSQSNPQGAGQGDVPALLRRLADTIEALQPVEVQDIAFHMEIVDGEDWPSATVYYLSEDQPSLTIHSVGQEPRQA